MFIVDTNVYSELMRPKPNENVIAWFQQKLASDIYTTSISVAESFYGLRLLDDGARKDTLFSLLQLTLEQTFDDRIISFGNKDGLIFSEIASKKRKLGKPMDLFDAQIAAITFNHSATLATRNIKDFEECGIKLENPWER